MAAVHNYPLIAVTEVFEMPSVDNPDYDGGLRPTEELLESKLAEVTGKYAWGTGNGYGWPVTMEFDNPIHIIEYTEGEYAYGHRLGYSYQGKRVMGNGHHRLAFQALVQGALFVPYCTKMDDSGW